MLNSRNCKHAFHHSKTRLVGNGTSLCPCVPLPAEFAHKLEVETRSKICMEAMEVYRDLWCEFCNGTSLMPPHQIRSQFRHQVTHEFAIKVAHEYASEISVEFHRCPAKFQSRLQVWLLIGTQGQMEIPFQIRVLIWWWNHVRVDGKVMRIIR